MFSERREGEWLEGTKRSQGDTLPALGPDGQVKWKRELERPAGEKGSLPRVEQNWPRTLRTGRMARTPEAGAGVGGRGSHSCSRSWLLNTQAKEAKEADSPYRAMLQPITRASFLRNIFHNNTPPGNSSRAQPTGQKNKWVKWTMQTEVLFAAAFLCTIRNHPLEFQGLERLEASRSRSLPPLTCSL